MPVPIEIIKMKENSENREYVKDKIVEYIKSGLSEEKAIEEIMVFMEDFL